MRRIAIIGALLLVNVILAAQYRPTVLLHGLGPSYEALSFMQCKIESHFSGMHVHNARIGNGGYDSLHMNINKQVEEFAKDIQSDPLLKDGFNLMCHSQGGLICRAYVERFNTPKVHNLISLAGPQNGVFGVPNFNSWCAVEDCPWLAFIFDQLLSLPYIGRELQENFSFAAYWKDPLNLEGYLKNNIFLADINNEREVKNATYRERIEALHSYILVYAEMDEVVIPSTSPWFQFFKAGSLHDITHWNETEAYRENFIGLRTLDEQGKLFHYGFPCTHNALISKTCLSYIEESIFPYLNNTLP